MYSLKNLKGKCPFCSSTEIYQGFLKAYGVKVGGSSNKYPDPNIEIWHCRSCKKTFEAIKEKRGD